MLKYEQEVEAKIKRLLEKMTYQILKKNPKNIVDFMIDYLKKKGGYTSTGLTPEEKNELNQLRKEVQIYRDKDNKKSKKICVIKESENESENENENESMSENSEGSEHEKSFEESEENDGGDDFDEKIKKRANEKKEAKRIGVSAEVYGEVNKKENFVARVIKKTDEQINRIKTRILSSFLFSNLEQADLEIVIGAMDEKTYHTDDIIIQQGEKGDCWYVIETGEVNCFKQFKKNAPDTFLKCYYPGDSFGEWALLYNAPRAATWKAKTKCILWVWDRETFTNIVKDSAQKKREKYENFLKKVDILSTIDSYELMQICDAVKNSTFNKNDFIIKENEMGDVFYILEEGKCVATKTMEKGKQSKEIKNYEAGEYFGERALIKGEPRYANIVAKSDIVKVLSLDRNTFKRLWGPIEPLLQRNMDKYAKFVGGK